MHVSKKYSNKTNSKHAVNSQGSASMQVTFGKQSSSSSSHNASNYNSVKSQKNSSEKNLKVESMLKNLDVSNKFTVGNKKIELKYEGEKKNGVRSGSGILYYSNGLCYEGEFRDGLFEGRGILKVGGTEYIG